MVIVSVNVSGTVTSAVGGAWEVEGQDAPLPRGDLPFFALVPFLGCDCSG